MRRSRESTPPAGHKLPVRFTSFDHHLPIRQMPVGIHKPAEELHDIQLPHLDTFATAAELGSFTGAARALHLTQAAVSQRIHVLEQELGKPLFERAGGRVRLSDAGRSLYDYAGRILELHRQARRDVGGRDTPIQGELLLAASSIPGEHLLPALLAAFRREHPRIAVRCSVSDSLAVASQITQGHANLGLLGSKIDNPHLDFQFLAKDRMVLVVPADHAWQRRKSVSVSEMLRQPFIMREVGSGSRRCFENSLQQAGKSLADLTVALELGSNEAIKEAVQRGLGIALLSSYAVTKEVKDGQLHAVNVRDLDCDRDIFVVVDRRRLLPLPARQFLRFLQGTRGASRPR